MCVIRRSRLESVAHVSLQGDRRAYSWVCIIETRIIRITTRWVMSSRTFNETLRASTDDFTLGCEFQGLRPEGCDQGVAVVRHQGL